MPIASLIVPIPPREPVSPFEHPARELGCSLRTATWTRLTSASGLARQGQLHSYCDGCAGGVVGGICCCCCCCCCCCAAACSSAWRSAFVLKAGAACRSALVRLIMI